MLRNYKFYILPLVFLSVLILEQSGILHIGYLYIKSHELRWTNLDYNYFPERDDIFTAGESITRNNYEDAILDINPDYGQLLQKDLDEIARNRKHIDSIDRQHLSFYSGNYLVKVCLDKKDISINDSTLFKKLVDVEIVGQYELYDKEGCDLLYQRKGRKFWIRDKIIMRGRSRRAFIINKIEEIWLAQMSNNAHQIISYFERPYIYKERTEMLVALQLWANPSTVQPIDQLQLQARLLLFQIDRTMKKGSTTYGHINDADYRGTSRIAQFEELPPTPYDIEYIK